MMNQPISLQAFQDIKSCMKPNNIRDTTFEYEMIVGDFDGKDIYTLNSFHKGTYAQLEDLGEKIISSNINTPSYRISSNLDHRLNFMNKESLEKFSTFNSKQFIIKQ